MVAAAAAPAALDESDGACDGYRSLHVCRHAAQTWRQTPNIQRPASSLHSLLPPFLLARLQSSNEMLAGTEVLDAWESCLFHCRHLKRAVEDLGAALYAPQDFEEVGSAALAVFEVTELMTDECPEPDAVGAQQLSRLAAQLTAAHERMQELLLQAQQEANNDGNEGQ
eukprot:GHRQ01033922.1.p2 GENE.GHRQ01033922.1~~GHRQ01033922.1.p2  ORF type:complete len:168 (+),score=72.55 GHRQ01033922.1:330-833(+)